MFDVSTSKAAPRIFDFIVSRENHGIMARHPEQNCELVCD
jgi:hypothetical protein